MTTNVYASHNQVMFTIGGVPGVFLTGYNTDDPDIDYIVSNIKENSEYGTAKWMGLGQDILIENLYAYYGFWFQPNSTPDPEAEHLA